MAQLWALACKLFGPTPTTEQVEVVRHQQHQHDWDDDSFCFDKGSYVDHLDD
jgi:hypothetical protein